MMKKQIKAFLTVLLCLMTTACFHLRHAPIFPPLAKTIYLDTEFSKNPLISQLKDQLQAQGAQWVSQREQACWVLQVDKPQYSHSQPTLMTSMNTTTITYNLTVNLNLRAQQHNKLIGAKTFSSQYNQILNASQMYSSNMDILSTETLQNDVLSLIYYWLYDPATQHLIQATSCNNAHSI